MSELVDLNAEYETEGLRAENFVRGVGVKICEWTDIREIETIYGQSEGFVYFIGIGHPYITHVKVGFTSKNPYSRMAGLQTGCPFKMRMLGFVVGNQDMESELHDVFCQDRLEGEWFEYTDHVARNIRFALDRNP